MLADAEEVVGHLRKTYGRRKIVLMGHSWGSILGMMLAQKHPDWFYAYVGMGQAIDFPRNEALGYQSTLKAAREDGNETAVRELEALAPFPDPADPRRNLQNLEIERKWLAHYGGAVWTGSEDSFGRLGRLSPDYSDADNAARNAGLGFSLKALWPSIGATDFSRLDRLDLPVVFLHGRHDTNVSAALLGEWFARLQAPSKKLVWFEDSAHMPAEEEPGKTLVTLVQDVLPLTRGGA
jgi:pimeloyl-ACP methyl ester carboxylesterase